MNRDPDDNTEENLRIPIIEEVAHVGVRDTVTGQVRVRTITEMEDATVERDLYRSDVSVERVVVNRWIEAGAEMPSGHDRDRLARRHALFDDRQLLLDRPWAADSTSTSWPVSCRTAFLRTASAQAMERLVALCSRLLPEPVPTIPAIGDEDGAQVDLF